MEKTIRLFMTVIIRGKEMHWLYKCTYHNNMFAGDSLQYSSYVRSAEPLYVLNEAKEKHFKENIFGKKF